MSEGRLGRLGPFSRGNWDPRCNSWATICSSPTPRFFAEGIAKKIANAILIKAESDRHTDGNAGRPSTWRTQADYCRRGVAPLGLKTEDSTHRRYRRRNHRPLKSQTGSMSRSDRIAKYNQAAAQSRVSSRIGLLFAGRARIVGTNFLKSSC